MVKDSASSVTTFSDWLVRSMIQKVGISDRGMATAVMMVARQSRRKMNTTATASKAPSSRASTEAWKLLITSEVVSDTFSKVTSARSASSASMALMDSS